MKKISLIAALAAATILSTSAIAEEVGATDEYSFAEGTRLIGHSGNAGRQDATSLQAGAQSASVSNQEVQDDLAVQANASQIAELSSQLERQNGELDKLRNGTPIGNLVAGANYVEIETSGMSAHGDNGGSGATNSSSRTIVGVRQSDEGQVGGFSSHGIVNVAGRGATVNADQIYGDTNATPTQQPIILGEGEGIFIPSTGGKEIPVVASPINQTSQGILQNAYPKATDSWNTGVFTGQQVYGDGKMGVNAAIDGGVVNSNVHISTALSTGGADLVAVAKSGYVDPQAAGANSGAITVDTSIRMAEAISGVRAGTTVQEAVLAASQVSAMQENFARVTNVFGKASQPLPIQPPLQPQQQNQQQQQLSQ